MGRVVHIEFRGDPKDLQKASTKARKALADVGAEARKTDVDLDAVGGKAGKAGSSFGKLAGSLGEISPAAGGASQKMQRLADVIEVGSDAGVAMGVSAGAMGVALAAVAEVLAVAYLAWKVYNDENEKAARISEIVKMGEEGRIKILDSLAQSVLDLKVATGELSKEEAAQLGRSKKLHKELVESTKELQDESSKLERQQSSLWTQMVGGVEAVVPAWTPVGAAFRAVTTSSEEMEEEQKALGKEIEKTLDAGRQHKDVLDDIADAEDAAKAETEGRTAAVKAETRAAKAAAEEGRKLAAALRESQAANKEKATQADKVVKTTMDQVAASADLLRQVDELDETEKERIHRQFDDLDRQLKAQIAADKKLGRSTTGLEEARKDAARVRAAKIAEIDDEQTEQAIENDRRRVESARATAELTLSTIGDLAGQIGDVAGQLSDRFQEKLSETANKIDAINSLMGDLTETTVDAATLSGDALVEAYKRGKVQAEDLSASQKQFLKATLAAEKTALKAKASEERKAAKAAFQMQKATAIAEAAVATALAVIQAYAQLGPIAGAVAAGVVGGIGAVQIGIIAAEKPTFASGGFIESRGTGAVPITAHQGEAVLSQQGRAAIGDDTIRAANGGRLGRDDRRVQIVYKHRAFDYFMSDHLLRDNSTSRTIRKGDRIGKVGRGRRS